MLSVEVDKLKICNKVIISDGISQSELNRAKIIKYLSEIDVAPRLITKSKDKNLKAVSYSKKN